jgi:hypothetical protein
MKTRQLLLLLFFLFCQNIFAQKSDTVKLDTVNIYKRIIGIEYHKCLKVWFCGNGDDLFTTSITTRQDRIISNDTEYYFKVYDFRKHLILEGAKSKYGDLHGEVKFYYKNGKPKRSEYYRVIGDLPMDDSTVVYDSDCPDPWGTWTYYNKKGRVTKTIVYGMERNATTHLRCIVKTTTLFDKRGKISSTNKIITDCEDPKNQ